MIRTRQNIDILIADLRAKYSTEDLREGFVKRTMEHEFKEIGAAVRPMATYEAQVWEGI